MTQANKREIKPDSAETRRLLDLGRAGDKNAFEELFRRHRAFVRQVIDLRLDDRLRSRLDPSDLVQETQMEAFRRLPDYFQSEPMPFHLWLRCTAYNRLQAARRRHLGAGKRSVEHECLLPEGSSLSLAEYFVARGSTPSQHLSRRELVREVRRVMAELSEADRDILIMRNLESLSNLEVAQVLAIEPAAARQRYSRALVRLRQELIKHNLLEPEP
jgi:RNA polymerase sigma-70 factor (ECF subfamily)